MENAQTGELKARVQPQANAKVYEGRIKAAGSEFGPSISFASTRAILFKGLTAGVNYTLQICAIGGSTGRSDWSDPVSKMAVSGPSGLAFVVAADVSSAESEKRLELVLGALFFLLLARAKVSKALR